VVDVTILYEDTFGQGRDGGEEVCNVIWFTKSRRVSVNFAMDFEEVILIVIRQQ